VPVHLIHQRFRSFITQLGEVSQLLMENRLAPFWQNQNIYAPRKDPAAIQMLINMIESL
jgi:hypothetical protein